MIRLPERSVTRFFIPLIDVLILLFCIFLLMPLASGDDKGQDDPASIREQARQARFEVVRIQKELEETKHWLAEVRKERSQLLNQRLSIRVLEIDPKTGKLFCYADGGERVDLDSADAAIRLIDRHRREVGGRELYYLFLFPRQDTGFPEQRQFEQYERWFAGVAHGLDNPRGGSR